MRKLEHLRLEEVMAAAHSIWSNQSTADKIAVDTMSIVRQTQKRKWAFYNGKSSKGLVSGLFYLLGFRYGAEKKQKYLAQRLGTTEMTVRAYYRKWLKEFPDLFLDVIGKFAQHNELRYFVLLELGQSKLQPSVGSH
jgi:hypothetical protein